MKHLIIPSELRGGVASGSPPRLELHGGPFFFHYLLAILAFIGTGLLLWFRYLLPALNGEPTSGPLWIVLAALVTVVVTIRRSRKLNFIPLGTNRSPAEAISLILEAAQTAGWKCVERIDDRWLQFWSAPSADGESNEGEQISVLIGDGVVCVNSINDPNFAQSFFSGDANASHAGWVEMVLDKGIWTYDPERSRAQSSEGVRNSSLALENIVMSDPPAHIDKGGFVSRDIALRLSGIVTIVVVISDLVSEFPEMYAAVVSRIGAITFAAIVFGAAPAYGVWLYVRSRRAARYVPVEVGHTKAQCYRLVLNRMRHEGWHINYDAPDYGMEARVPNATLDDGHVGALLFGDGVVYCNLLASANMPAPSLNRSERDAWLVWVRETLAADPLSSAEFADPPATERKQLEQRGHPPTTENDTNYLAPPNGRKFDVGTTDSDTDVPAMKGDAVRFLKLGAGRTFLLLKQRPLLAVFTIVTDVFVIQGIVEDEPMTTLFWILAAALNAALVYYLLEWWQRLKMIRIVTRRSARENYELMMQRCEEWGWVMNATEPDKFIEAYRESEEPHAEMITMFFEWSDVYVNSINKLEDHRPSSIGHSIWTSAKYSRSRNRENILKMREALESAGIKIVPAPDAER